MRETEVEDGIDRDFVFSICDVRIRHLPLLTSYRSVPTPQSQLTTGVVVWEDAHHNHLPS